MPKLLDPKCFLKQAAATPLLDIRAPSEYLHGHIPGATSLPLFSDEERVLIGTLYKESGHLSAVLEGLGLIGPKLQQFGQLILSHASSGRICVYCARGGMRSSSFTWLAEQLRVEVCVLEGGYRSYRNWVSSILNRDWSFRVIGGFTGVGKTRLLQDLHEFGEQTIDLEGLANHKGSAFGGIMEAPQPTQSQFENNLATSLAVLDTQRAVWIEDESKMIGYRAIPLSIWNRMRAQTVIVIERPTRSRVDLLEELYGAADSTDLIRCIDKIKRRLGDERTSIVKSAVIAGDIRRAIELILKYYDKKYLYGLGKRERRIKVDLGTKSGVEAVDELLSNLAFMDP